MKIGFETIGNATVIVKDSDPLLVTDPWITAHAYFGSWSHTHEIPEEQRRSILSCPYVWFSHGHPDHLNSDSLPYFKEKTILLPDHLGGRIKSSLEADGYRVQILKDRRWYPLSPHVRVLSWSDHYQDAMLLIDLNGRLIINCNDAVDFGRQHFVSRLAKQFKASFLLSISSLGIADMTNYYRENGEFINPTRLLNRPPSGIENAKKTERFGARYFLPSSSFHEFQRTDSAWANKYSRSMEDLYTGFKSDKCEILPAFIRYDCETDEWERINPKRLELALKDPVQFGDNWNESLSSREFEEVSAYFKRVEHFNSFLDFINLRIGGKDHTLAISKSRTGCGVTFEVPRSSLMAAVNYNMFEDLLIGNFMKTTLHGVWKNLDLNPDFSVYLGKYADNGLAYSDTQVQHYLNVYARRAIEFRLYYWLPKTRLSLGWLLGHLPGYRSWRAQSHRHI